MLIFEIWLARLKIDYADLDAQMHTSLFARARQLCLLVNNQEKWPLAASNDLWGQNEYASNLNEVKLKGVYEVMFLAKISHFGVKREQTANKQTQIALIYR